MFDEYNAQASDGKLHVDECYTTKDQVHNYTLIHVMKKVRDTNVQHFVAFAEERYNIVQQHIIGYAPIDSIKETAADGTVHINPIFQMMLKHKMENNPFFQEFKKEVYPKSGGLLNPYKLCKIVPSFKDLLKSFSSTNHHTGKGKRRADYEPEKRFRTDDGASGSAMVVEEAVAHPVLAEIEGLKEELEKTKEALVAKDNTITAKDLEIATLRAHVAGACTEMVQLAQESSEKVIQIAHFNEHLVHEVQQLEDEINVKTERAEELDNKRLDAIDKLEKDNEKLKDKVHDLEIQVDELPR